MFAASAWIFDFLVYSLELCFLIILFRYVMDVYRDYHRIKKNGHFVKGRTTGSIPGEDIDNQRVYAKVVEFFAADGELYSITSNESGMMKPQMYEEITILYKKDNPSDALINPIGQLIFRIGLLFAFSVGALLFDLFVLW